MNRGGTRFADSSGVRIAWEEHGSGHPLLLVHGLGYARWGWEPLVPLLARHHRVVLFDNRGIGDSDVPPGPYRAGQMAGDALAVLDASGASSAHVVGSSLGGMISQELAIEHPERVDRLVLLGSTPGGRDQYPMPEVTVRLIEEAPSLPPEEALRRFVENALGGSPDPVLVERILRHRLANPQDPAGWQAQAAAGTGYDSAGRLGRIAAPTLILHGIEDRVLDPRNAELLAREIPGARVRMIEGGHIFYWQRPQQVARLLTEFLEEAR